MNLKQNYKRNSKWNLNFNLLARKPLILGSCDEVYPTLLMKTGGEQ